MLGTTQISKPITHYREHSALNQTMIWSRIFPKQGGPMSRWWRVRKTIVQKAMRDGEHMLKGPVSLFDFSHKDDAFDALTVTPGDKGGWRISDDEVIRGFSRANARLIRDVHDYKRVLRGEEPLIVDDKSSMAEPENPLKSESEFVPFIRWSGTTDTNVGDDSRAVRSGFCALRSPVFPFDGANLSNKYSALEVTCRSDGRVYNVNLNISTYFPDDMYQGVIDIPATHPNKGEICPKTGGEFVTFMMPFRGFLLTSEGRVREVQRALDGGIRIQNIGLTLMDGEDGDFQFDIARIRAVNFYHGEILGETDDEAPY